MTAVRCGSCAHWKRHLPIMSDARLDPSCPDDMGGCTVRSPEQFMVAGFVHGFWPRTHESYGCNEFMGGGDSPPAGNVSHLRPVA